MANMQVTVVDGNNVTVSLDRGVAGVGIASVQLVVINQANYLLITYTNGTTQTVGPVGVIQYNANHAYQYFWFNHQPVDCASYAWRYWTNYGKCRIQCFGPKSSIGIWQIS